MVHRTTKQNGRRGQVTVEFAFCLPVLLLIFFAAFEFCRTNIIRHTADNAAYEAARRAIVPGASARDARRAAANMLAIVGAKNARVRVRPAVINPDTPEVTVTIRLPMNSNGWIAPHFMKDKTINTSFTLAREQYEQTSVP